MPSRTKAQSEFSKELGLLMLPGAFPGKGSKEADDAVMDQGTVEGVVVGRTAARSLPDTFSDKVVWTDAVTVKRSREADDAVTARGTAEGVAVVRTGARSLPDTVPDRV